VNRRAMPALLAGSAASAAFGLSACSSGSSSPSSASGATTGHSLQQSASSDPDIVRTVVTDSFLSTIPLVVLFLVLQRYWRSGLTSGALT
jgi:ABC-type glycerol-3-phosphate transport system permease component